MGKTIGGVKEGQYVHHTLSIYVFQGVNLYDVISSTWQQSVVFCLTQTKPNSFIGPQSFKKGLITNRKVMIYSSRSPHSAHTQSFVSEQTHVRKTCNTGDVARSGKYTWM